MHYRIDATSRRVVQSGKRLANRFVVIVGSSLFAAIMVAVLSTIVWSTPSQASPSWCVPNWNTLWGSSSGPYASGLALTCTPGSSKISGTYNEGTVAGILGTDADGNSTFTGNWTRTTGGSGSTKGCQGGLFSLVLAPDGQSFSGFWSYCSDPVTPRSAHEHTAWSWKGIAAASQTSGPPLDLISNINLCTVPNPPNTGFDQNGFPLNPTFRWFLADCSRLQPGGPTPDASVLCHGSNSDVDLSTCISQPTDTDDIGFNIFTVGGLCHHPSGIKPHSNWSASPVTLNGIITWNSHEASWPTGDDDYNFELGIVPGPLLNNNANSNVHSEFQASEVIDNFTIPWWVGFHSSVDNADARAHDMIDGRRATITGVLGMDWVHPPKIKSHPIYGMAIEVNDSARDNTWIFMVRNWGNEGMCSSSDHQVNLPNSVYAVSIPTRSSQGSVTWSDFRTHNYAGGDTINIDFNGGPETVLTFPLPQPGGHPVIEGELHIDWGPNAPPGPRDGMGFPLPGANGPGKMLQSEIRILHPALKRPERDSEPEAQLVAILKSLPEQQQTRILQSMPPRLRPSPQSGTLQLVAKPRTWRNTPSGPVIHLVENRQMADQALAFETALCRVTGKRVFKSGEITVQCDEVLRQAEAPKR